MQKKLKNCQDMCQHWGPGATVKLFAPVFSFFLYSGRAKKNFIVHLRRSDSHLRSCGRDECGEHEATVWLCAFGGHACHTSIEGRVSHKGDCANFDRGWVEVVRLRVLSCLAVSCLI